MSTLDGHPNTDTQATQSLEWVDQDQLTRTQKALLALSGDVAQRLAEAHGVCVRPLAMRRLDLNSGRVDVSRCRAGRGGRTAADRARTRTAVYG